MKEVFIKMDSHYVRSESIVRVFDTEDENRKKHSCMYITGEGYFPCYQHTAEEIVKIITDNEKGQ